jgi:hypothetical protein
MTVLVRGAMRNGRSCERRGDTSRQLHRSRSYANAVQIRLLQLLLQRDDTLLHAPSTCYTKTRVHTHAQSPSLKLPPWQPSVDPIIWLHNRYHSPGQLRNRQLFPGRSRSACCGSLFAYCAFVTPSHRRLICISRTSSQSITNLRELACHASRSPFTRSRQVTTIKADYACFFSQNASRYHQRREELFSVH